MNTKRRTYLDTLNAGRQRRSGSAIEEINRTLNNLANRLENALETREAARQVPRARGQHSEMRAEGPTGHQSDDLRRGESERNPRGTAARRRDAVSTGAQTTSFDTLREEMQTTVNSGIHREIGALRGELERLLADQKQAPVSAELNTEIERLSDAIALLAKRSDNRSAKMLRLELEQMKAAVAKLAREETVRSLGKRWDSFETRFSTDLHSTSDRALERLAARLEEISAAVDRLPDSLSIRSLDERMQQLAKSLERLLSQRDQNQPELYGQIEERLDEISRAINASTALASSRGFDPSQLERIEARISSLGKQIDELVQDQGGDAILERLATLSERVDDIAKRVDIPEQTVKELAAHLALISDKVGAASNHGEADRLLSALEERFADLSDLIVSRQEHTIQHGEVLFQNLERRLEAIAERIEHAPTGATGTDLRALEERLDDIADRLQDHAVPASGVEPEIVHELASQVANLTDLIAHSGQDAPAFREVAPRLDSLERSLHDHHVGITESVRQATIEATRQLAATGGGTVDDELRQELQKLEALTRHSDERNARTFEAIHDTLLKIVSRLGDDQAIAGERSDPAQDRMAIGRTPSTDPTDGLHETETARPQGEDSRRTPAEAASEAAAAALRDERNDASDLSEEASRRRLLGSRLSRALSGRRGRTAAAEDRESPENTNNTDENLAPTPEIDPERINEPLEPGSGAPDLNTILRRVRDEGGMREQASDDTAKSDFVAAARRAAKAAAAEAEMLKHGQKRASEKGRKRSLGGIVRGHKKSLLMLAGAAVVVAGGLHFGGSALFADPPVDLAQWATSAEGQPEKPERDSAPVHTGSVPGAGKEPVTASIPARPVDTPENAVPTNISAAPETTPSPSNPVVAKAEMLPDTVPAAPMAEQAKPGDIGPSTEIPEVPVEIGPAPLREAAADGQPEALYEIGNRYAEGHGVETDMGKAAEWYRLAAERGLAPAQYRIGNLHEKGQGVTRNVAEAKTWYQLAAQQGNASAMHNLGVLFAMGADGVADNASAARWFLKAAEAGLPDSQVNLGILSAKGIGVARDLGEAYKWFAVAAKAGDNDAGAKRDEVARAMTPDELAKAEAKAKLWQAHEPAPEANVVEVPDAWKTDREMTASVDMTRAITNVQAILNQNGYDAGPPDGVMGERTRMAIKAFQEQNGLADTGEINDTFVRALLQKHKANQQ